MEIINRFFHYLNFLEYLQGRIADEYPALGPFVLPLFVLAAALVCSLLKGIFNHFLIVKPNPYAPYPDLSEHLPGPTPGAIGEGASTDPGSRNSNVPSVPSLPPATAHVAQTPTTTRSAAMPSSRSTYTYQAEDVQYVPYNQPNGRAAHARQQAQNGTSLKPLTWWQNLW
ncbi:uncharacterized protein F4807DRAFT_466012 [Annulohypoxylon truncatum]|uniref:uncharacterized protein n=1 Tax=Annulohypoxylon truncatum TaxID=327061 RepID=UPI0020081859|nr:uncharacterized protein F4807DRAFT_466012 [Annulohypoxylon truncatum]KAI1204095.1 hypothetical protein F4807DRAFT_466012 [Annulohypoxylon truncatum]